MAKKEKLTSSQIDGVQYKRAKTWEIALSQLVGAAGIDFRVRSQELPNSLQLTLSDRLIQSALVNRLSKQLGHSSAHVIDPPAFRLD